MPRRSPRFLAIAHLKGGSGATTLAVNLAAGLALKGKRVALLDLDPVAASTFYLVAGESGRTITDVLEGRARLADVLTTTAAEGLTMAPASRALSAWDRKPERFPVDFARALETLPPALDYVLLDLPPSAGAIVRGTLAVLPGGRVLAPVQVRALDLVGFGELVGLIEDLREQNPALHLAGVVPVRVNRTRLAGEVLDALRQAHPGRVLPGIRESAAVARSPLARKPLALSVPSTPAAEDFAALTRAVLRMEDSTR